MFGYFGFRFLMDLGVELSPCLDLVTVCRYFASVFVRFGRHSGSKWTSKIIRGPKWGLEAVRSQKGV